MVDGRYAVNVLMVTGAIPNAAARSGAAVVLAGQVAATAERHRVTLVTFAPVDRTERQSLDEWKARGVSAVLAGGQIPVALVRWKRRLDVLRNRLGSRHPRAHLGGPDARFQAAVDRAIATSSFDLIQFEHVGTGTCRLPSSVPRVLTEHEVGRSLGGDAASWRHTQPEIWRGFDRLQVFTHRDAHAAVEAAPDLAARVRVNPFGIDMPAALDPTREEKASLLFVGGFEHPPNVDAARYLALELMPELRGKVSELRLLLVGHAPPADVRELETHDIVVTGGVPDVRPYLERAALVLAPVRSGGGMRRKVLEAMAAGKTVVTTMLGAEGLYGSTAELPLVVEDEPLAMAQRIRLLLSEPASRRALGEKARAFVAEHHSWTAYADRQDAMYRELLKQ